MQTRYCILILILLSGCMQQVDAPTTPLSSKPILPPETESSPVDLPEVKWPDYTGDGELAGHTWQVGEATFSFQRGNHVLVRGGHLDETMPTGAPGRYTLEEGVLHLEVLSRDYTGLWNGQELSINEHAGIYRGETERLFPDPTRGIVKDTNDESGENHEN